MTAMDTDLKMYDLKRYGEKIRESRRSFTSFYPRPWKEYEAY